MYAALTYGPLTAAGPAASRKAEPVFRATSPNDQPGSAHRLVPARMLPPSTPRSRAAFAASLI
ncbi:hypothetical protein QMN58_30010, partial [Escherichia coli]|nr:hypothetical protein [Escherichia coli]